MPFGRFYGFTDVHREIPGFSASLMSPRIPVEEMPRHTHEEASFVLILRGTYLSSAAGAEDRQAAPFVVYNPPGTTHRDCFQELDGARFLGISISKISLAHAGELVTLAERPTAFKATNVVVTAQKIARECSDWINASALLAEAHCWELLAQVATIMPPSDKRPPAWLLSARDMICDTCSDSVRVTEIARAFGVHPVQFVRTFRRHFRATPGEYLRRCRAEKAASLLERPGITLAMVAVDAGYSDQSQFSKAFKQYYGVTPGQYRLAAQSKRVQI